MDEEINEFLAQEFQRDAEVSIEFLEHDLQWQESANEVLDVLYAVSLNDFETDLLPGQLAKAQYFGLLRALHGKGVNVFHIVPSTSSGRLMLDAVEDAVMSYDAYRLIRGADTRAGRQDTQIEDDMIEYPLTRLFAAVQEMHGDTSFWLKSMRALMPRAKILGDDSTPDQEVLLGIQACAEQIEADNAKVNAIILVESAAVDQAVKELLPGELDCKQAVVSALRAALTFRKSPWFDAEEVIPREVGIPTGIARDTFMQLLLRSIELSQQE